jgi:hypothetical protein
MSNMQLSIISVMHKTSFETDHRTLTILLLLCKKQLKKWGPGSPMSCSSRQKTMHDAEPNGNKHQIPSNKRTVPLPSAPASQLGMEATEPVTFLKKIKKTFSPFSPLHKVLV